jgi:hypothetical protein
VRCASTLISAVGGGTNAMATFTAANIFFISGPSLSGRSPAYDRRRPNQGHPGRMRIPVAGSPHLGERALSCAPYDYDTMSFTVRPT